MVPKIEVAMSLLSAILMPLMIFGGLFINNNDIVIWLRWLEWISIFKWGF